MQQKIQATDVLDDNALLVKQFKKISYATLFVLNIIFNKFTNLWS